MANQVMGKEKSEKGNLFAKGGSNKMAAQGSANPAEPGVSANKDNGPNDNKFGIGYGAGKGKMFGEQDASTALPGESSPSNGRKAPDNKWGLPPSKGKMAGWTGAQPQKPA